MARTTVLYDCRDEKDIRIQVEQHTSGGYEYFSLRFDEFFVIYLDPGRLAELHAAIGLALESDRRLKAGLPALVPPMERDAVEAAQIEKEARLRLATSPLRFSSR